MIRWGADVRNGDVFIFIGSSRKLMKLIHAEDGGMVMYVKRLEAGRFRIPEYDPATKSYPMEWRDLVIMVEGFTEDPFHHALAKEVGVLRKSHASGMEKPIYWKNRSRLGQCAGADWDTFDAAKLMIFSETVAF